MSDAIVLSTPVRSALADRRPVVALETSVLAQGLPHPRNLEAMEAIDTAVVRAGAEPAWISIDRGLVRVGTAREDLVALAIGGSAMKVARRDLPMAMAAGRMGATTVSATLWVAHRAGIDVMATGGIGGVHIGSGDVSADLLELARTPGTVVCSGPKSIVDPAVTLERLEELGVGVVGYRCDRLPFFLVRATQIELEHRADSPQDIAAVAASSRALGIDSALVVCNPIPEAWAMDAGEVDSAVQACLGEARPAGLAGKALTPFLLSCLGRRTNGRSIDANLALLESNARLAAEVAGAAGGL